jgi:hypothetical protein
MVAEIAQGWQHLDGLRFGRVVPCVRSACTRACDGGTCAMPGIRLKRAISS